VLESEAYTTLPHSARSTLVVIAAQFSGKLNGAQILTRDVCKRFGVVHDTALRDAAELIRRGLVIQTYKPEYWPGRRRASRYALAWLPIQHNNDAPLEQPIPASNDWATWTIADEASAIDADADGPKNRIMPTPDRQSADEGSAIPPSDCRLGVVKTASTADQASDHLDSHGVSRSPSLGDSTPSSTSSPSAAILIDESHRRDQLAALRARARR
jgi:hypothetical protein